MKWKYKLPSNTIWVSFDYGEVEADNYDSALTKAEAEIRYQMDIVNEALRLNPETQGLNIDMDFNSLEVKEVTGKKREFCNILEAEDEDGFQEYVYDDGERVPHGTPIGVEYTDINGIIKLVLLENVWFSSEPRNK